MPNPTRPRGRPSPYGAPAEPEFAAAVAEGYEPALIACRDLLSRRLDGGVPAREVAALVSVARAVDKAITELREAGQ
ncbi:hypothetical protein [Branchiibius cervicis]|uniref:Uncharacterized protein n=1 Tax=Branchiibius cervicis TaxID=908252 RepID=A0ABW2AMX5_9MICO